MILAAITAVLLTASIPFLGVIFTSSIGAAYLADNRWKQFAVIALAGFSLLAFLQFFTAEMVLDGIVAMVGLGLFIRLHRQGRSVETALSVTSLGMAVYAGLRTVLFKTAFLAQIAQTQDQALELMKSLMPQATMSVDAEMQLKTAIDLMADLYTASWVMQIVPALYLGGLILRKKGVLQWNHAATRFPFEMIYLVIAGLVAVLIPALRLYGLNLLLMLSPLFVIQGVAVIEHFLGRYLRRSIVLTTVLIIVGILNGFVVMVASIGLFDVWFNFRKITDREESHENNPD